MDNDTSKTGSLVGGFALMDEPYIHGYAVKRPDGLRVEVVRCYEGEWNVFLTQAGSVVARSVEEYRQCRDGYLTRSEAFRIAQQLAGGAQ